MNRLSNRLRRVGTIGLAAMMLFTNIAFADEVPNNVGAASYHAEDSSNTEAIPGEAGVAAWLSEGDTSAYISHAPSQTKQEETEAAQQTRTVTPAGEEEEEHASVIALERRRAKYDSLYKNYVFPDLSPDSESYINVRKEATSSSELVGKLYAKTAAKVLETVDGEGGPWFKITSGNVTGYVKAYYFITGSTAEDMAKRYGDLMAVINTESLRLREKASLESEQIAILSEDDAYPVIGEEGAFVKVQVDDDLEGYVLEEYIHLKVIYKKAISIEEEQAAIQRQIQREREAEEAAERARREAEQREPSGEDYSETRSSETQETKKSTETQETKKSETKESKKETKESKSETKSSYEDTSALRKAIVKYALSFVGEIPYIYGGENLKTGVDCSGFTQQIYKRFGISLPRSSRAQQYSGKAVSSANMRPGDICYYGRHVAIYIGDGKIVHAANRQTGIKISRWNYRKPITIRNVIGD